MADEALCCRGVDLDYDRRHVPAVANYVEDWGLVSKYGLLGINRIVLRHGYLPPDPFLRDRLYGTTWTMVVSEPI